MDYDSDEDTVYKSISDASNSNRFETEGREITFK